MAATNLCFGRPGLDLLFPGAESVRHPTRPRSRRRRYNNAMIVILFDIDGTLVNTGGAGSASLLGAFSAKFDVPRPTKVPFSGRTDRGIANDMFRAHGIEDSEENWQELRNEYLRRLPGQLSSLPGVVLPGVLELLNHLASCEDVALGLLTGNVRDGARIKLGHFALFDYFAFGGFGDAHRDRDEVARDALAAAEKHLAEKFFAAGDPTVRPRREQVWVIGDTPLDIRCARAIGAKVVAVATGTHPRAELHAQRPDLLLDDLADPGPILSLVER